jgi:hypothetical protein
MKVLCTVWFITVLLATFFCGCRYAPNENQKDVAFLTHKTALAVNENGALPNSPPTEELVQGTLASTLYYGTPESIPKELSTEMLADAQVDAKERPDIAATSISLLEILLGSGLLGIGSTAFLIKVISSLRKGRAVALALKQVVSANKEYLANIKPEEAQMFKDVQSMVQDTPTKQLVAEIKATS